MTVSGELCCVALPFSASLEVIVPVLHVQYLQGNTTTQQSAKQHNSLKQLFFQKQICWVYTNSF